MHLRLIESAQKPRLSKPRSNFELAVVHNERVPEGISGEAYLMVRLRPPEGLKLPVKNYPGDVEAYVQSRFLDLPYSLRQKEPFSRKLAIENIGFPPLISSGLLYEQCWADVCLLREKVFFRDEADIRQRVRPINAALSEFVHAWGFFNWKVMRKATLAIAADKVLPDWLMIACAELSIELKVEPVTMAK